MPHTDLTTDFKAYAEQVMQRCETLGKISQSPDFVDRRYLTPEHKQANEQVSEWMRQTNMQTWQDGAGNVWGRYLSPNKNAKSLLMGSHLDTVINGGKYDGMLGVVVPIALVQALHTQRITLPFNLDIVGFCDEEGTRFGSTLLGSRALTGQWHNNWADLCDEDGISLKRAMVDFGLDFEEVMQCKLSPSSLLAFIELHIEQGPVLEQKNLPTGIVSGIAGAKRLQFTITGMAGHAGTVPMDMRKDALICASEMILSIESVAKANDIVATVGAISNKPNAVNVISGSTDFSLDIRSNNDALRDEALADILRLCEQIANKRELTLKYQITHSASAVSCDESLIQGLCDATSACNIEPLKLISGAGHDAMAMADLCPIAMLFTRCDKGISHHPAEAIQAEDVEASLDVLFNFITHFQETQQAMEING
ncbi:allantoate amidohydrolase [Glaciecola petra]|uniref:Allantoate amidohydrolase n=1 Tax=Glaciecola petra TaxID=3075602 RepID=A0ABU2ZU58_9ALTE|nr:allantoate amidohydrolase [Aestuariibacter sp. P117]MDT0596173.1 allantoate amidohydrolase [Aestuariibacter sp. P117]